MFFPLFDNLPRLFIEKPWVTWGLIAVCCAAYLLGEVLPYPAREMSIFALGIIPDVLFDKLPRAPQIDWVAPVLNLVTYIFLHGSFGHLAGNMVFLWVFGDNIEDIMGHRRFLVFFLACGFAAGLGQALITGATQAPIIGASGAISGVLGAYLLQYPRAKVLVPIIFVPIFIRAKLLLLLWIGFQIVSAFFPDGAGESVAWWAHIIGFFTGMALIPLFRHSTLPLLSHEELPRGVKLRKRHHDK